MKAFASGFSRGRRRPAQIAAACAICIRSWGSYVGRVIFEVFNPLAQVAVARLRQFVPFTIAGLIATGVNYGTLYLFLGVIGLATIIAVSAAFALSAGTNFFLQKFWAFGEKGLRHLPNQLLLFVAASLFGLMVNDAVFWMFNDVTRVGSIFAEIPTTAAVSAVGFFTSRYIFTARAVRRSVHCHPSITFPRVRAPTTN
jgi:putative flippase GtrA